MKPVKTIILGFIVVAIVLGSLWLANAPLMPPTQKIEQVLPDERIPH